MRRKEAKKPSFFVNDQKCYDRLAANIVKSAAEEYMNTYRLKCKETGIDEIRRQEIDRQLNDYERFFKSDEFCALTTRKMEPEAILTQLRKLATTTERTSFGLI